MAQSLPDERRSDTVAVSRTAAKFVATLATALFVGVTGVLWNLVLDNVRTNDRLAYLERFGPGSGDRFTKADAARHDDRIARNYDQIRYLYEWKNSHTEWGRSKAGKWEQKLSDHERRLGKCEDR